jgi:tRNA threonylcarbamoyladenosine biosynthesis protein TsaB
MHSERLMTQVDEVLRAAGCSAGSLDGVAVSSGPGSFTGLRIGMSVAKGLAYAHDIPLIGVSTLEALALHAAAGAGVVPGETVLAVLDARRDEVYCQMFLAGPGGVQADGDVCDLTVREVRTRLAGKKVLGAGDAVDKVFGPVGSREAGWRGAGGTAATCSAVEIALLGGRMLAEGRRDDPVTLEPRYIKDFFLRTP